MGLQQGGDDFSGQSLDGPADGDNPDAKQIVKTKSFANMIPRGQRRRAQSAIESSARFP
jgi:hypothetical protein